MATKFLITIVVHISFFFLPLLLLLSLLKSFALLGLLFAAFYLPTISEKKNTQYHNHPKKSVYNLLLFSGMGNDAQEEM